MHPSQGLWFPGIMAVAWLLSPARGRLGVWLGLQPQKRGVSKCSVQPGGCQRGRTPRLSGLRRFGSSDMPLGTAVSRLNGTLRNITIFSDVSANTYTAVRRGGKKAGRQAPVEDAFILKGRFTMGRKVGKGYKRRFLLRGKRETVSLIIHKNLEGLKKRRKRLG